MAIEGTLPVGPKLREARIGAGITSTRAAQERLRARGLDISHATIANYESGKTNPPMAVLNVLADFYGRPLQWFLERSEVLVGVEYRNLKSKVKASDRAQYESAAAKWLTAYRRLEEALGKRLQSSITTPTCSQDSGRELARHVRELLKLNDSQPIASVVDVLHAFGIRQLELPSKFGIDGLAAQFCGDPVVVLNPLTSNDRSRLNAAHELGHHLFGDCDASADGRMTLAEREHRVYEFASCFLLPDTQVNSAFQGRSFLRLLEYKERFGISLAAMIYRAEKIQVIDAKTAKWLWIEFAKRGWRKNEPGKVWVDRPMRFEQLIEDAIRLKKFNWRQLECLTAVSASELRSRLGSFVTDDIDTEERGVADAAKSPVVIKMYSE